MTNLSPNLETILADRSIGSIPLALGSAGFIMGAQWGPMNKAISILSPQNLKLMYGSAIFGRNHLSWASVKRYLDLGISGTRVVRAGKDDSSTKNAVKFFSKDLTATNSNNGTSQLRKLNAEDESFPSIESLLVELDADVTWTVGQAVTNGSATANVGAIMLDADNEGSSAYAWLIDVDGTFAIDDTLTDSETVPSVADIVSISSLQEFGVLFHEAKLTLSAGHSLKVGIGSIVTQGTASGLVIGKGTNILYLANVTGTFTANDITAVDDIEITAGRITIASVDVSTTVVQSLCFFAKYPGTEGNSIQVAFCDKDNFNQAYTGTTTFASLFDVVSLQTNEIALVITYKGELVEKWIVSLDETATLNGLSLFIENFLNDRSNYLGCYYSGESFVGFKTLTSLAGGDAQEIDLQSAKDAYDELFKPLSGVRVVGDFHELEDMTELSDLQAYISTKTDATKRQTSVICLKKDIINPLVFDMTPVITAVNAIQSKFVFPVYEWEEYNNSDIRRKYFIPSTAVTVGIIMRSLLNDGDIEAPAGLRRGTMTGTTRLYYNLEEGSGSPVSELYKYGVNAHVMRVLDSGQTGYYLWGNRTLFNPLSDMSRFNVVSALITDIQKLGSLILPFVFEGIDETTTFNSITQTCEQYLTSRAVRAFYLNDGDGGYRFTCSTANNTALDASEKTINVDFEVKYRPASEYIKLRISVTGAGVDFQFV